jgi:threonine dehydrogenase-like Zn-dependent dehydrogenase
LLRIFCALNAQSARLGNSGTSSVVRIDLVSERIAFTQRWLGNEEIDLTYYIDIMAVRYGIQPDGVDYTIDAAAIRYVNDLLHLLQRAVGLKTDLAKVVNEVLLTVRMLGTVALVADFTGLAN